MNPTEEIQERMKLIKAHQNASVSNNFTPEHGTIKLSKENFEKAIKEQKLSVYTKDGLNRLKQDIQTHSSRLEKGENFNVEEEVKKVEEFFKGLVKVDVEGSIYFLQKAEDLENDELEKAKYFKRTGTPGNYKYYYTEEEYKRAKRGNEKDYKSIGVKHFVKKMSSEDLEEFIKENPNSEFLQAAKEELSSRTKPRSSEDKNDKKEENNKLVDKKTDSDKSDKNDSNKKDKKSTRKKIEDELKGILDDKKDSKEEKPKHNFSGDDDAFAEQISRARGVYDKYKDSDDKKEQVAAAKAKKFLDAAKDHDKKKKESK